MKRQTHFSQSYSTMTKSSNGKKVSSGRIVGFNNVIILVALICCILGSSHALAQSVSLSTNAVEIGQTVVLSWSGFSGNVNIEVWKGSSFWVYASTNVAGSGSQNLVTTGWQLRSDYWVKVVLRSNTSVYRSTSYFSVSQPSLSISTTSVTQGQTVVASWSGFSGNINLEVWKGNSFWTYANTNIAGSGSQNLVTTGWEIRSDYRAKVVLRTNANIYRYSSYFSVQPPIPTIASFAINNGVSSTSSRTITLNNSCNGSPTYYMASENSSFNGASWLAYSTAPSFVMSSGNGTKTIYFKVRNNAGESSVRSDQIVLNETTLPSVTSFSVNNGASSTSNRSVTLNNNCTGSPTYYMASENSSFSGASWLAYSTAPSFLLSSGNGTKTIYFKVRNNAGESSVRSDQIVLNETTLPTITSFAINNGASSTSNRSVTLNNVCSGNPTHYMASQYSDFRGALWQVYSSVPTLNLFGGNGNQSVYLKVKNNLGESSVKSDFIALSMAYVIFNAASLNRFVAVGDNVIISGTVYYANGAAATNYRVGVEDGLARMSALGPTTDYAGRFSYTTAARYAGMAEVAFFLPDGNKQSIFVNVSQNASSFSTTILGLKSLSLYNPTSRTLNVEVTAGDVKSSTTVPPGQTVPAIVSNNYARDHFPLSPAAYGGVVFGAGVGVASVDASVTVNTEGTVRLAVGGGLAVLLSGKVYVTSTSDFGLCWTPLNAGVGLGPIYVDGEAGICLGTDGVSVGAGLSSLAAVGFSIKVWDPNPPPVVETFSINNGASSTSSRAVTLNNTCRVSPTHYIASENSSFSGASWQSYSTAPTFTLSAGNGTKRVYFKVKNSGGESPAVSDDITLSETSQVVTIWSESFEVNSVPGSFWSATDANATNGLDYWGHQSISSGAKAHHGSWSVYCAQNSDIAGQQYDDNMLASFVIRNGINVSGYTNVQLSFWVWYNTESGWDYLRRYYSSDGVNWTLSSTQFTGNSNGWQKYAFTLNNFVNYWIKFEFYSDGSVRNYEGAYVDEITITGTPRIGKVTESMGQSEEALVEGAVVDSMKAEKDASISIPTEFALRQNYPNPFNPSTIVQFDLKEKTHVKLEIFNALGEIVATIINEELEAGRHQREWKAVDVSSGIYFYRLVTPNYAATRKMILVR